MICAFVVPFLEVQLLEWVAWVVWVLADHGVPTRVEGDMSTGGISSLRAPLTCAREIGERTCRVNACSLVEAYGLPR